MVDEHVPDADAAVVAGEPVPSQRLPLDRERIIAAAIMYVEEHGLASLTMRRLGTELHVEAMSLYRYVPGRDQLLDGMVEAILEEMLLDQDVLMAPENGWEDFLQRFAHGVRRIALAHPSSFPLVASRPPEAPWLRPPLRSLRWVGIFLDGLISEGFDDASAVAGYRAFTSFLLGHLLLEVAALGADLGPLDVIDEGENRKQTSSVNPTVDRLRDSLTEDHSAAEFEIALEDLLNRLATIRAEA